jgi:hypothetical protein
VGEVVRNDTGTIQQHGRGQQRHYKRITSKYLLVRRVTQGDCTLWRGVDGISVGSAARQMWQRSRATASDYKPGTGRHFTKELSERKRHRRPERAEQTPDSDNNAESL